MHVVQNRESRTTLLLAAAMAMDTTKPVPTLKKSEATSFQAPFMSRAFTRALRRPWKEEREKLYMVKIKMF